MRPDAPPAIDIDSASIENGERIAGVGPATSANPLLFAGTLTDPAHLSPSLHTHADEQLPWFEMLDNLPRYAQGNRGQTPMRYGPREARK